MATTQSKRLGRGLGSLISGGVQASQGKQPSRSSKNPAAPKPSGNARNGSKAKGSAPDNGTVPGSEFMEIAVGQIVPNPFQPRKYFDEAEIADLVASIKSEGLLQPIVVREVDGKYELIAGERRYRAIKKLKRAKIPARVIQVDDLASAALSLIENLQRADLNPIEEARGYETLMREFGLTQDKTATRIGKSRAYVANALRLLQLDASVQELLAGGQLSVGHAKVLLGLPSEADRRTLARRIVDEGMSVRDAEDQVRLIKGEALPLAARVATPSESASALLKPTAVARFEKSLGDKLAASVEFKHGAGDRGRIVIDYKDMADLDRIMATLV